MTRAMTASTVIMMLFSAMLAISVLASDTTNAPAQPERWSEEKAWAWYKAQPWLVGFNFVPSTACNTTEWWQEETLDPGTIDRELGCVGQPALLEEVFTWAGAVRPDQPVTIGIWNGNEAINRVMLARSPTWLASIVTPMWPGCRTELPT